MSVIEWSDALQLGVEDFDEHHRHLISLLNRTYDEFVMGAPRDRLETILYELIDYATYHFAAEEYWMAENSYPGLAKQKNEHDLFSAQISDFHKAYMTGSSNLNAELLSFLAEWVTSHILNLDSDYGRFHAEKCRRVL